MGRIVTLDHDTFALSADSRVGGWGDTIADEGAGFGIAISTIRSVYRKQDGWCSTLDEVSINGVTACECDHMPIFNRLEKHFNLEGDMNNIVKYLYDNFDKRHIAAFTVELIDLVRNYNDPLATYFLKQAGIELGRMARALVEKKCSQTTCGVDDMTEIVAVGSMWKCLDIFGDEFKHELGAHKVKLVQTSVSASVGAAWLSGVWSSTQINIPLERSGLHKTILEIN
eukprot:gnl/Carplike_NY0171/4473_a6074_240.p1 GENE.gnl/Carplike_NY0171/4473_a6074_240~~gnl/Carplike_NY0171/4473_a6074_240.p1  ORF type:complete len:227 (+),score=64.64 gnl/Carplike_NY0171/4473_a6074_240:129-809(+)